MIGPKYIEKAEDYVLNVKEKIKNIEKFSHVLFLGKKPKRMLPALLNAVDVCIIPYNTHFGATRYCNPMKAFEYLAVGKPIVSTEILSMKELPSRIIKIAYTAKGFSKSILWFLNNWTRDDGEIAKKVAYNHRWGKRVSTMEKNILQKVGYAQTNPRISMSRL